MTLTATIIQCPQGVAVAAWSKTFAAEGGSIGRGQTNDWVLEDPERYLSSVHCRIDCEGGHYFLTDSSTNGTFVNEAIEPVGRGNRVEVQNGDQFTIGEYTFRVELKAAAQPDPVVADDPFAAPPPTPFGAPAPEQPAAPADNYFAQGAGSGNNTLFTIAPEETDPLAALDAASRVPAAPDDPEPVEDFFDAGSYADGADPLNQALDLPRSTVDSGEMIPEDWDKTGLGHVAPSRPLTEPPAPPPPAAPPPPEPAVSPAPEPASPPRPAPAPAEPAQPSMGTAPQPSTRRPRPGAAAPKGAGPSSELIAALGLEAERLSDEALSELDRLTGAMIRETVSGLMNTLQSRSAVKNQFRMHVTTIQPAENNPLKFSADVDDALEHMFVRRSRAYKPALQAVQESFEEIAEHQLAVIAGMQQAFKSVLEYFDPEKLSRRFDQDQKGAMLLGSRKARYWEAYENNYRRLIDDIDSAFQEIFGDEFVQAYEEQLKKLSLSRKQQR